MRNCAPFFACHTRFLLAFKGKTINQLEREAGGGGAGSSWRWLTAKAFGADVSLGTRPRIYMCSARYGHARRLRTSRIPARVCRLSKAVAAAILLRSLCVYSVSLCFALSVEWREYGPRTRAVQPALLFMARATHPPGRPSMGSPQWFAGVEENTACAHRPLEN